MSLSPISRKKTKRRLFDDDDDEYPLPLSSEAADSPYVSPPKGRSLLKERTFGGMKAPSTISSSVHAIPATVTDNDLSMLSYRPIELPSIKRRRKRIAQQSKESWEKIPENLNISGLPVTPLEIEQFKQVMLKDQEDEVKLNAKLAANTGLAPDKISDIVKMRDVRNWIDDNTYYGNILTDITQLITTKNPLLKDAYDKYVDATNDPFLLPRKDYAKERAHHGLKGIYEPRYRDPEVFVNEEKKAGGPDMTDPENYYRVVQLEKIIKLFEDADQPMYLSLLMGKPRFAAAYGRKRVADDTKALSTVVMKEQIRALDPTLVIRKLIAGELDKEILKITSNLKAVKDYMRVWYQKLEGDRIAAEQGYMKLYDYSDEVKNFWHGLQVVLREPSKSKAFMGMLSASPLVRKNLGTLPPHDPTKTPPPLPDYEVYDPPPPPVETEEDRKNQMMQLFNTFRDANRKRVMTQINIFNSQLADLEHLVQLRPELSISQALDRMLTNVVREVNEGKIDIDQAYSKMNAMHHKKKAILKQYAENYEHLTAIEERDLQRLDEEGEKTNLIAATNLAYKHRPVVSHTKYIERLRDENGLFAWGDKGVNFEEHSDTYKHRKLEENVFDPGKGVKNDINKVIETMIHDASKHIKAASNEYKRLESELDKSSPKWKEDKEKNIKEMWKILRELSNTLRKSKGTNELEFDPHTFPIISDTATYKDDEKSITEADWKFIKDEYFYSTKVFSEMRKWLSKHKNVKGRNKTSLSDVKTLIKKNLRGPETTTYKQANTLIEFKPKELHVGDTTSKETAAEKERREKKYTYDNIKYAMTAKKEYPEILKTEIGDNVIEYNVKTEDDLKRMRSEVHRLLARGGELYVIDFKTGRLYPIKVDETYIGQAYVFIKDPQKEKTAFAMNPARDAVEKNKELLLPYAFMRHDKMMRRLHQVPGRTHSFDWTHQIKNAAGAGLWGHIKDGIKSLGTGVENYAVNKTHRAINKFSSASVYEGKNFVKQEKRNLNTMYNAGANFIKNPSFKNFSSGYYTASNALGKLVLQPVLSGAREYANVNDLASNIPGLNIAKYGAEWAIPPLAVANALSHGVKNLGMGSDDKPKYLDAIINMGDAILGSQVLSGNLDASARILQTGVKIGDALMDQKNH